MYDDILSKNPKAKDLKTQVKFWNKVAKHRNKVSHSESSPMKNIKYKPGLAQIYSSSNEFIPKLTIEFTNIINEINDVKDSYLRIAPGIIVIKEFVENAIREKGKNIS